jgi:hypothetical protein
MPDWGVIVIVVAVIAAAVVAWVLIRRHQSRHLRARFHARARRLKSSPLTTGTALPESRGGASRARPQCRLSRAP